MLAAIPMRFLPCSRPLAHLTIRLLLLIVGLGALSVPALAQEGSPPADAVLGLTGGEAEPLADRAVRSWLEERPDTFTELSSLDTEALCRELPGLFAAPPPPSGTEVDLSDRRERDLEDPDRRRFTYAAEIPPDRLDVVEVVLVRDGEEWAVDRVGFQAPTSSGRSWLQTSAAAIGFVVFTLLVIAGLARPGPLRRWTTAGLAAVREHRRLVAWTMAFGWAIVALGLWTGSRLPASCEEAVLVVLSSTLEQVGATQAVASGNLARAAVVIFYQNFVMVTVTALFGSALLLGVPAYLLAGFSFLAQTTAFGLLGLGGLPQILLIAVLFVLEFTSYFLIVAGGGMLVATLVRKGFTGLGEGYTKLTLMLPLAGLLLLIGAWYEAVVVIGF